MQGVKPDLRDVRRAVRRVTYTPNPGRKISAIGLALILCPDPFSDIVGVPLFAVGEIINRYHSSANLKDVPREVKRIYQTIKSDFSDICIH